MVIKNEPKYIKFYYNSSDKLSPLTTKQATLLFFLLARYESNNGECYVKLDSETKQEIAHDLRWSDTSFENALRALKKNKVIEKRGKDTYVFDPEVFGAMNGG